MYKIAFCASEAAHCNNYQPKHFTLKPNAVIYILQLNWILINDKYLTIASWDSKQKEEKNNVTILLWDIK